MTPLLNIQPPVIAHRGASAYAPENTLAAFKKAKALGAAWVELDVMLAACGELVVFHDETLERTTNGKGKLHEHSYAYLKTLDAGSWFNPPFAGEHILSLKQTLEFLAQNKLCVNIELKPLSGQEEELAQKVLSLVGQIWPASLAAPLLSSFSLSALKSLRSLSKTCAIGFLMDEILPNWETHQSALNCASININQAVLNPETIRVLKAAKLPLLCYTVNQADRALELFSWGVDAVFSDCPDQILQVISA